MPNPPTPTGQRLEFQRRLQEIWEDPQVRRLARSRARDFEMAQDALQEAYCSVARVNDPDGINDLKAYFCKVLIHVIKRLLGQLREVPEDDFESLSDARQGRIGAESPPLPFDEAVCGDLHAMSLLDRFAAQCETLTRAVPGRSADPARYRDVIVAVAGSLLRSIARGDVSEADGDQALIAVYPEWFAEQGPTADNAYQRFSRARGDIRKILQTIVDRDEFFS